MSDEDPRPQQPTDGDAVQQNAPEPELEVEAEPEPEVVKFSPEEEAALLQESNDMKSEANTLFAAKEYTNALSRYEDAIASCPIYLHYPRAVLQSNIAACCLMAEEWKDAIKASTTALDCLAKLDPEETKALPAGDAKEDEKDDDDVEEEVISTGATRAGPAIIEPTASTTRSPPPTTTAHPSPDDIQRIRSKALLRRARARSQAGGWQNLAGAEEDYRELSKLPQGQLTPGDARTVRTQLRELPPRTKAAQEHEMGEVWGKLKSLGDGILKPFGLSTQNFQMNKDEATGGYSMNFNQGGGAS